MGTAPDTHPSRRRWSETRLGRGLLFVAIVWSIAGGFLILLNAAPALSSLLLLQGWVSLEMAVNPKLREEAARRCSQPDAPRASVDAATLQQTRFVAFQMGFRFGTAAVAHSSGTVQPGQIAPVLQEVRLQAFILGVPAPELPVTRRMAEAIGEFTDDLEADRQCTAARLASRYTPAHGDIYRFGVVVGAAVPNCIEADCTAYAVQIRRYGKDAGVPEHLWLPMARGSLADVPGPNVREKTFRVVADLIEHFQADR